MSSVFLPFPESGYSLLQELGCAISPEELGYSFPELARHIPPEVAFAGIEWSRRTPRLGLRLALHWIRNVLATTGWLPVIQDLV